MLEYIGHLWMDGWMDGWMDRWRERERKGWRIWLKQERPRERMGLIQRACLVGDGRMDQAAGEQITNMRRGVRSVKRIMCCQMPRGGVGGVAVGPSGLGVWRLCVLYGYMCVWGGER